MGHGYSLRITQENEFKLTGNIKKFVHLLLDDTNNISQIYCIAEPFRFLFIEIWFVADNDEIFTHIRVDHKILYSKIKVFDLKTFQTFIDSINEPIYYINDEWTSNLDSSRE